MQTFLILTILGPDKTGLVQQLATTIARHEGNWVESRMHHLGGQFAGILRASIPQGKEMDLLRDLEKLRLHGLQIQSTFETAGLAEPASLYYQVEVLGPDRPGIVARLFAELAARAINVEELSTGIRVVPWSGEVLFQTHARLHLPLDTDVSALAATLDGVAKELNLELTLERIQHL